MDPCALTPLSAGVPENLSMLPKRGDLHFFQFLGEVVNYIKTFVLHE